MKVKDYSKLIEIANANNGIVKTSQAVEAKVAKDYLKYAVADGVFEKLSSGIYLLKGEFEDDMFLLQLKRTKIIYSHTTSAYFNGLTTRDPIVLSLTVPNDYKASDLIKAGHKVYFCSQKNYTIGITETQTMFGNTIRIYDTERTICDLFSARFTGDTYVALESLRTYLTSKEKDIYKLLQYAEQLGVEKKLRESIQAMNMVLYG